MPARTIRVLGNGEASLVAPFRLDDRGNIEILQDANETLSYTIDWTGWLGTDTISTSTWTASGLTASGSSSTTKSATTKISGVSGSAGYITNKIVTAAGLTKELTFYVREHTA